MRTRACGIGAVLIALGAGLLLSLLITGWFARVLAGAILIAVGYLICNCE